MNVIYNSIIPFKGYIAINIFGVLFARKEYKDKLDYSLKYREEVYNHESIHTEQMKDFGKFLPGYLQQYIGGILFYIVYIFEWMFRLLFINQNVHNAYRNISFEKEAYKHETDLSYIKNRKIFGQWRKN